VTPEQQQRYSRHLSLAAIGVAGQERLIAARVLIIGVGGLGSPAAIYLAAAGVGTLVLVDFDTVELHNLQRQILHQQADIGRPKVASAHDHLQALNPEVNLITHNGQLDGAALYAQVAAADVVLDCSDNFATRFELNAICVAAKVPLISGAALRSEGQITLFDHRQPDAPCYRCLYRDESGAGESCTLTGVLAPVVGVIGTLQALEAVKLLTGAGTTLAGRLLLFDALALEWRTLRLRRDPACPVCGANRRQ